MKKILLFSISMILISTAIFGQKTVGLDNWFNHETSPKTGKIYHYTWDDTAFSGFSELGDIFKSKGAELKMISAKPDSKSMKSIDIYIIVDPDIEKENPQPNYVSESDVKFLQKWVKNGGVLLLMSNDGTNCEFVHFNKLAGAFGLRFNPVILNPVINRDWEMGAETNLPNHPLFTSVNKIYMKEVSSITLSDGAKAVLKDKEDIFIAECSYGKGYVLAVGDPWLYNEYIDHALLPASFENLKVANNLVGLLMGKIGK